MTRTRRSRKADQAKLALGLAVFSAVILAIGALGLLRHQAVAQRPDLDPKTDCPKAGPLSVTVVLVDRTDPISPITQLDLRNRLKDVAGRTPKYGALYMYALDGASKGVLQPLFFHCNPGDSSSVSELNASTAKVQRRFEAEFAKPLDAIMEQLVQVGTAKTSPIMEAIQAAAVTAFGDPSKVSAPAKELIVVSDFMQNSDEVSFYGASVSRQLKAPETLEAPLRGVQVGLLFIQRPGRGGPRIDELKAAWREYFIQSGVAPEAVRPVKLTGANP